MLSKDKPDEKEELSREEALNFTKVADLNEERKVASMYKELLLHVLKIAEYKTTLAQDMELLSSEDLNDWKMRFAVIYRSERKKIIHSQLHVIDWIINVLRFCDQSPSRDELDYYYRHLTFKKTQFEERVLSGEAKDIDEKMRTKNEEDYFLRRIHAKDYLKAVY